MFLIPYRSVLIVTCQNCLYVLRPIFFQQLSRHFLRSSLVDYVVLSLCRLILYIVRLFLWYKKRSNGQEKKYLRKSQKLASPFLFVNKEYQMDTDGTAPGFLEKMIFKSRIVICVFKKKTNIEFYCRCSGVGRDRIWMQPALPDIQYCRCSEAGRDRIWMPPALPDLFQVFWSREVPHMNATCLTWSLASVLEQGGTA